MHALSGGSAIWPEAVATAAAAAAVAVAAAESAEALPTETLFDDDQLRGDAAGASQRELRPSNACQRSGVPALVPRLQPRLQL